MCPYWFGAASFPPEEAKAWTTMLWKWADAGTRKPEHSFHVTVRVSSIETGCWRAAASPQMVNVSLRLHFLWSKMSPQVCQASSFTMQTVPTSYKGKSACEVVIGPHNFSVTYTSVSTTFWCSRNQTGFQWLSSSPGWIWPLCVSGKGQHVLIKDTGYSFHGMAGP